MHLIFSKLKSANTLNGVYDKDRKKFFVEFAPEENTKVSDKDYDALIGEKGGTFGLLIEAGEFVESATGLNKDVAQLQGEIKKLELLLKAAQEKANLLTRGPALSVDEAELALMQAEDDLAAVTDSSKKKGASKVVKDAKKALDAAKKAAKA